HSSFKWANLASYNAGVTVVIVGMSNHIKGQKKLFSIENDETIEKQTENINAYLVASRDIIIPKSSKSISNLPLMKFGNKPVDGGNLLIGNEELKLLGLNKKQKSKFI